MSRIDRSAGQDETMERRHIQQMLRHMDEYELVKQKVHKHYKTAKAFYEAKGLCKQNFLKFYRRYLLSNRDTNALIPCKAGRKFKDTIQYEPEILDQVKQRRKKGYQIQKTLFLDTYPRPFYKLLEVVHQHTHGY